MKVKVGIFKIFNNCQMLRAQFLTGTAFHAGIGPTFFRDLIEVHLSAPFLLKVHSRIVVDFKYLRDQDPTRAGQTIFAVGTGYRRQPLPGVLSFFDNARVIW